jgi:hypothetical protein
MTAAHSIRPDVDCNNYKGKVSEAGFALQAVIRGWDVIDAGGAPDFDRIIKKPHTRAMAVQVKRAYFDASRTLYIVNCSKTRRLQNGRACYSATAFDVLAAHLPDIDKWVFYTRPELGNRQKATYILPDNRKNKTREMACSPRNPDNWELLDEIAATI